MKIHPQRFTIIVGLVVLIISTSSCVNNRIITYFPTLGDSSFIIKNVNLSVKIQKGDIIMVIINASDPESASLFSNINNVSIPGTVANPNYAATPGLLVENDGTIKLPKIGSVKALGKTKVELEKELQELLLPYLKDPIVNIRFMNYRVTVLGEVGRPGTIYSTNERITILEALGQSGDITTFGNRTNILILRDSSNITVTHRINILNNSVFASPYFYLQSNDVLYIEPRIQKAYSSSQAIILIPIISSVLTTLLLIFNVFKK
jgi:polysaccharide export outer membrane protein